MDATLLVAKLQRSQIKLVNVMLVGVLMALSVTPALIVSAQASTCEFWVAPAPAGNNANPGTSAQPWATLEHGSIKVAQTGGSNCVVWFKDGIYTGPNEVHERYSTTVTFKAVNPYRVILQNNGPALDVKGGANMVFEGFQFRHTTADSAALLVYTERSDNEWAEYITFRNNIFHDSYNNDLLKLMDGSRFIVVEGNVFYNQGAGEQHMDVNSVTDVTIQDNIFFNDFAANANNTKHFIVIKDSNDGADGLLGSERVTVRRNIFLNWQGAVESFVKLGNDGKPFYEAKDIRLENNLMIGSSPNKSAPVLGVSGARDVVFANNTIVGDLPSSAYAFRALTKDLNPINQNIFFYNNIWSDPTGTMGSDGSSSNDFSDGDPAQVINVILDNNLYWNGGAPIPDGEIISPLIHDIRRVVGDPKLNTNQASIILPRWNGNSFLSGNATIRQEFERLVGLYGQIPSTSLAVNKANPLFAPASDILQRARGSSPDMGAYEATSGGSATSTPLATRTPTATRTGPPTATPTVLRTPTPTKTPGATSTPPAQSDLIFADGFESSDFSAWSSSRTDGADLSVSPNAALVGAQGMQLTLDDSIPIFVTDDLPTAEARYRVRFQLDPNSIRMGSGESFILFSGNNTSLKATVRLLFSFDGSRYRLRAQLLNDAQGWINSAWIPITDEAHVVELDWRAATQPGANNGGLTVWLDGQQSSNLTSVDNDGQRIERAQFGAVAGIDWRTRGVFFLDAFESRRETYIGP